MKVAIRKIERVIERNDAKLKEITNNVEPESSPAKELYRLMHCFMGDLYALLAETCMAEPAKGCDFSIGHYPQKPSTTDKMSN